MRQDGQEHAVDADGCLDTVRHVAFVRLGVEILDLLAGQALVVGQVEVGPRVDAFQLLEAEREVELDIRSGIGVVRQLLVVVEAVVFRTHAEVDMPLHAVLLPGGEPLHLRAGTAEEFHFHLLELAHAEDELAGDDLVAEGLSDLGDAERDLHAAGLLHVQVLHEDALGRLGTQVDLVVGGAGVADGSGKHQVELADVGPVRGAGDRADDAAVDDDVAVRLQVVGVLCRQVAGVHLVVFGLFTQDVGVRRAELRLVEAVAEPLAALGHLLLDLLLDLAEVVFDQVVGTIALLGVLVVDERVVERRHVAGSHPRFRMHEHAGVDTHHVLVQAGHGIPPVLLDVVLELHAHLAIIVHGGQAVINLAGREDETIFLAMRNQHLEQFVLCHIR